MRDNVIELCGDITSNVNVQLIRPVTLNGDVPVTSGSDATYYTQFTSTIDGGYDLAVNSGAGRAVFAGATPVANVQVTSSPNNFITGNMTTLGSFTWDNTGGKLTLTSGRTVSAGDDINILADVFTNLGGLVAGGTINTPWLKDHWS
ncbi:MAG: hypothetical protein R3C18_24030 [Planctomycetaceae bacterium]